MLYHAVMNEVIIAYFSNWVLLSWVLCHIGYYGIGYYVTLGILALGNKYGIGFYDFGYYDLTPNLLTKLVDIVAFAFFLERNRLNSIINSVNN